ncbi:MAG: GNAT family N-acetyltransferase [Euryarchaeota archaeon]|jgi:GNAT superfamily N-acetyltransferase|nr:GNAT family N-acetyltransferase [Euryarchaeota archaeon]
MINAYRIQIRNNIEPGDIEDIISLHGTVYAQEYGFDETFEQYVAEPLHKFAMSHTLREKIWIVEQKHIVQGCLTVVKSDETKAQLRWFLLHPDLRSKGIGKKLLDEAVQFTRENGYTSLFLWTVSILEAANKLYTHAGFHLTEEKAHTIWGKPLIEQRFELDFPSR